MPESKSTSPPSLSGPPEHQVEHLLQELGRLYNLETPIRERTLGAAMARRLRSLRPSEPPDWGSPGDMTQVARLKTDPLDFYYLPHLFPDMDPALRLGHQLQFDLLPRSLPAGSPLRIAAVLESYCHLSGDLLGWRQEDDQLLLWIADVSGHGVRAGLAAAVLYFLVETLEPGQEPAAIARDLNDKMLEARNESDPRALYATAFWLRFGADGRGVYASSGHPPMQLRRASAEVEELGATGTPLGLLPDGTFDQAEFRLERGDSLCLFTDGLIEARDGEEVEFGRRRLARVLRRHTGPPLAAARTIYRAVQEHKETRLLDDDLTFLIAEPAGNR